VYYLLLVEQLELAEMAVVLVLTESPLPFKFKGE
jgi:hypothetical protein